MFIGSKIPLSIEFTDKIVTLKVSFYILTQKNKDLNLFHATGLYLHPLKTSENL